MRIGLDLDNTLVTYDRLFHTVATDAGLIPPHVEPTKLAVREHLRSIGAENTWIELQGEVYGGRMDEAEPCVGALEALQAAAADGHELYVMSHRTRRPFKGRPYDLHASARRWIARHLHAESTPLVAPERVFLETTKEEKLARIRDHRCEVFIDDLPEILLHEGFPAGVRKVLFDADMRHAHDALEDIHVVDSWKSFLESLKE